MRTLLFCILAVAAFAGFARVALGQAVLRPGDTVEIRLAGVPSDEIAAFTAAYVVDDAGMLNLPYIEEVRAGGLPPNQVQTAIESKLKTGGIYTHPTVTVIPPAGARFVNVGGAVRAPGRIPYTSDLTLMSTINAAGGFNDFADQKRIRLVHAGKVQMIDIRKIRKDPSLDPKISPGDQIEVSQSWW
jgi:protein involved in polysaccharide export with SLBB domain